MDFSPLPRFSCYRWCGLTLVLLLHLLVGWVVFSGSASRVIPQVLPPVAVALITPPTLPIVPPPPPPPLETPREKTPLPKVVPLQQAAPEPAKSPVVETVLPALSAHPPSVTAITPTAPALPAAELIPPSATTGGNTPAVTSPGSTPKLVSREIGMVCPTQVKPEWPKRALQEGINGYVKVMVTVRGGRAVAVDVLVSKPRGVFDAVVKQAIFQYRCESHGETEVQSPQEFDFKLEE